MQQIELIEDASLQGLETWNHYHKFMLNNNKKWQTIEAK